MKYKKPNRVKMPSHVLSNFFFVFGKTKMTTPQQRLAELDRLIPQRTEDAKSYRDQMLSSLQTNPEQSATWKTALESVERELADLKTERDLLRPPLPPGKPKHIHPLL